MSSYTLLKSKLHRATVTGASLHYEGSLTVAEDLAKHLRAATTTILAGPGHWPQIDRPDEMMAGKQVEHIVQQAILQLEPTFRECLVLRDVEELSYEEIGAITGLPEGTVKSRIHRARAQLKELVERALGEKIQ